MNKFVELANERKQAAFALLNSQRVMSRDSGELSDLVGKKVTIDRVEMNTSKATGEPFVVFTVEEIVDKFYFAPTSFKKDVLYAHEMGYELSYMKGMTIIFSKKDLGDDRFMYVYTVID